MKKQWNGFFAGVLVTIMALGIGTTALAAYQKQATLNYSGIKITLNGQAATPKDANGNVVEPFAIDGTTYLPVRGIAGVLGLDVQWEQETQTVKLSSATTGTSTPKPQQPIQTGKFDANKAIESLAVTTYQWKNSIGTHLLGIEIKNNYSMPVDLNGSVTFLGSDGAMIGAQAQSQEAIPPNHTTILVFSNEDEFSDFKIAYTAKESKYYVPVVQDISITSNNVERKVVVQAANNGSKVAKFVSIYAIFFKDGAPIYGGSRYCVDSDSELKPGATQTCEIDAFQTFDSVKLYVTGRGTK